MSSVEELYKRWERFKRAWAEQNTQLRTEHEGAVRVAAAHLSKRLGTKGRAAAGATHDHSELAQALKTRGAELRDQMLQDFHRVLSASNLPKAPQLQRARRLQEYMLFGPQGHRAGCKACRP